MSIKHAKTKIAFMYQLFNVSQEAAKSLRSAKK